MAGAPSSSKKRSRLVVAAPAVSETADEYEATIDPEAEAVHQDQAQDRHHHQEEEEEGQPKAYALMGLCAHPSAWHHWLSLHIGRNANGVLAVVPERTGIAFATAVEQLVRKPLEAAFSRALAASDGTNQRVKITPQTLQETLDSEVSFSRLAHALTIAGAAPVPPIQGILDHYGLYNSTRPSDALRVVAKKLARLRAAKRARADAKTANTTLAVADKKNHANITLLTTASSVDDKTIAAPATTAQKIKKLGDGAKAKRAAIGKIAALTAVKAH